MVCGSVCEFVLCININLFGGTCNCVLHIPPIDVIFYNAWLHSKKLNLLIKSKSVAIAFIAIWAWKNNHFNLRAG